MIKKFLVVGKQVYLQTKRPELMNEQNTVIELLLPIEEYWKVESKLKHTNYLQASSEPQGEVVGSMRDLFKLCAPYAVLEKDRMWLYGRAGD